MVRVGQYELIDKLGEGGMGEVYLAKGPGGQFALKTIKFEPNQQMSQEEKRHRITLFMHEAAVTERLRHANIVRVVHHGCERIGRGSEDDLFYLVVELMAADLEDYM